MVKSTFLVVESPLYEPFPAPPTPLVSPGGELPAAQEVPAKGRTAWPEGPLPLWPRAPPERMLDMVYGQNNIK